MCALERVNTSFVVAKPVRYQSLLEICWLEGQTSHRHLVMPSTNHPHDRTCGQNVLALKRPPVIGVMHNAAPQIDFSVPLLLDANSI